MSVGRRGLRWCLCGAMVALGVVAQPALGTWGPPADISAPGTGSSAPEIAVAPDGDAAAAWLATREGQTIVQASARAAGGPWRGPTDLSGPGAHEPQVAIGASGDAVAVWSQGDGPGEVILASVRPADGAWQPATTLSAPGQSATAPRVAIDGRGNATVAWLRRDLLSATVQVAARRAGGSWEAPADLSTPGDNTGAARLAVDPQSGEALVVWEHRDLLAAAVWASSRPLGGAWSPQTPLSVPGQTVAAPQPALAMGRAVVVWERQDLLATTVQAVSRLGGAWEQPIDVAPGGRAPQVAVDLRGGAVAAWLQGSVVQTASRPAGSGWGGAVNLSDPAGSASAPQVAVGTGGGSLVSWQAATGAGPVIQASSRSLGGSWSSPADISGPGARAPQAAADGLGSGVVAWTRDAGGPSVQVGVDDVSGPLLRNLVLPPAVPAGSAAIFAVSPLDAWSPLGTVTWQFGDGATAVGNRVAHTYTSVGPRTVTLIATDARGGETRVSRTISVGPPRRGATRPIGSSGALTLDLRVPKQRVAAVVKAKAITVVCRLGAAGTCVLRATVPAVTARSLRLKVTKRQAITGLILGNRSAKVRPRKAVAMRIPLAPKTLNALKAALLPRTVRGRPRPARLASVQLLVNATGVSADGRRRSTYTAIVTLGR